MLEDRSKENEKAQYHECFPQIEKDLNRTFDFQFNTKQVFEKILKKIANHFPAMGYTQGVNFVVGYLLILGYSEEDTFWMFIHLATSQRYLLLGLYEDGFPLANVYTKIFKSMLRRIDKGLYSHIYENLMLDESVWIFKWFITCYIYSFPLQVIKFVWDLMVELGGLALVYFAVSLVVSLRDRMLGIDDACDMSEFMQNLKNLEFFNECVKIDKVIETVYGLKANKEDLEALSQSTGS